MTAEAFRCAEWAEARGEPLYGTASFVRRWILLEQPGSWGRDALVQSDLQPSVADELRRRARHFATRIVLIRRGVRISSERRQCYFVRTDGGEPYLAHMSLESVEDLLDVDIAPLVTGGAIEGASERSDPCFLVCTHGRHDACCSIRGNQVSRVACADPGADAWECSHIGGDRFAANMVCFPHGIYYGRLDSSEVAGVMDDYARGELRLDRYRGRCSQPFAVQAAEYFVRRETGITSTGGLHLAGFVRGPDGLWASFALADARRAEVEVKVSRSGAHRLTCSAERTNPIPRYDLVSIGTS